MVIPERLFVLCFLPANQNVKQSGRWASVLHFLFSLLGIFFMQRIENKNKQNVKIIQTLIFVAEKAKVLIDTFQG